MKICRHLRFKLAMKAKNKRVQVRQRRGLRQPMTAKGLEIVASLSQAIAAERSGVPLGSMFSIRTIMLPDEPSPYDAANIRATRGKIGVSQTIFAHLLGVSVVLVRAWEQGQRQPAMWARRLLDEVNHDPQHWRRMLRKAS
jgi:putative transcriptional regulator